MFYSIVKLASKFVAKLSSYGVFTIAGYEIGQKLVGNDNSERATIEIKTNSESKNDSILLPVCIILCIIIVLIITCACVKEVYFVLRKEKKTKDNRVELQKRVVKDSE